jgi:hypothetical protein
MMTIHLLIEQTHIREFQSQLGDSVQ